MIRQCYVDEYLIKINDGIPPLDIYIYILCTCSYGCSL